MFKKLLAAVVLVGIAIGTIWLYGNSRHDQGKAEGVNECNAAAMRASTEALRNLERIELETSRLSDSDIDRDLHSLGIMRAVEDR